MPFRERHYSSSSLNSFQSVSEVLNYPRRESQFSSQGSKRIEVCYYREVYPLFYVISAGSLGRGKPMITTLRLSTSNISAVVY